TSLIQQVHQWRWRCWSWTRSCLGRDFFVRRECQMCADHDRTSGDERLHKHRCVGSLNKKTVVDYRRTTSRADRSVAHGSRVAVGKPGCCFASVAAASRRNSLWGSLIPGETQENRGKFAIARTPSPARETRALPSPLETERT